GVFNSGILATGATAEAKYNYRAAPPEIVQGVRRIADLCAAHGVPLAVAALRFALGHPAVATVVIGAASAEEVARNRRALDHSIPRQLWSDLMDAGLLRPGVPLPT